MKVYIAGPMGGIPDFNYPEFEKAAALWRSRGHKVLTPPEINAAIHGGDTSKEPSFYIWHDLKEMIDFGTQAVALLPHWYQSRGACLEAAVAMMCDIPLYDAFSMARISTPPSITVRAYEPRL